MINIYIFLRAYNDIDHTTPLIDLLFKKKKNYNLIICTFLNKFELKKNHNIEYLTNNLSLKINFLNNEKKNIGYFLNFLIFILKKIDANRFFNRVLSIAIKYLSKIANIINKKIIINNIDILWGSNKPKYILADYINTIVPPFSYISCRCYLEKIKLINLPHGLNIFTEQAVHPSRVKYLKNLIQRSEKTNSYYDYIITPNSNDYSHLLSIGNPKEKIFILGSLRFEKDWINFISSRYKKINNNLFINSKKKNILILINKLLYGGKKEDIKNVIKTCLKHGNVLIKNDTRTKKINFINKLIKKNKIFIADSFDTNSLVMQSDIIVFWGTSVAIQPIMQNKRVIYAKFTHNLSTIFDNYLKDFTANNNNELNKLLSSYNNSTKNIKSNIINNLEYEIINGSSSLDPKNNYLNFFEKFIK